MQKKFRLDIDDLAVSSFVVSSEGGVRGTVRGHDQSEEGTCTTCWGDSNDCTNNPAASECAVSAEYCTETDCWVSRAEYGYYGC
jgi:hypothetical protein